MQMSFNPTAVVLTYEGGDEKEFKQQLQKLTGQPYGGSLEADKHYVVFMGEIKVLSDVQLRTTMGRV